MTGNLVNTNSICLQSLTVKRGSLMNLNSLVINNYPQLNSIVTENGHDFAGVFYYVKVVEISSSLNDY